MSLPKLGRTPTFFCSALENISMKYFSRISRVTTVLAFFTASIVPALADGLTAPVAAPPISISNTVEEASWGTFGLPTTSRPLTYVNYNIKYQSSSYNLKVRICQRRPAVTECTSWSSVLSGTTTIFNGDDARYPFILQARVDTRSAQGQVLRPTLYANGNSMLSTLWN